MQSHEIRTNVGLVEAVCPKCKANILIGIDDETMAVDPEPEHLVFVTKIQTGGFGYALKRGYRPHNCNPQKLQRGKKKS